jgi:hypothetical protein
VKPAGQLRPDGEAARVRSRGRLAGLLALAVTFSAGMHAALVPEHLKEMPPLGWSFIVAAALGLALAYALVSNPQGRGLARLAALFLGAEVLAWVLFVSVRFPGFDGTRRRSRRSRWCARPASWPGSPWRFRWAGQSASARPR